MSVPPRPLDQDPPLVLARWYRQEHRAPWDGSWFGTMLHTTEGGAGANAAENGAAYNKTRDSVVSCHVFCDDNSTVQSVPDGWVSFSAGTPFNDMYRMVEICGRAAETDTWWSNDGRLSEIAWNLARHVRQGVLTTPLAFCYAEDLVGNPRAKGIVTTHAEATRVTNPNTPLGYVAGYPKPYSTNDHTDPGFGFYPPSSHRHEWDGYPIAEVFARAQSYLQPPGGNVSTVVVQCTDAFAAFEGELSQQGILTFVRWIDGPRKATLLGAPFNCQQLDRSVAQLSGMTLVGPLPTGDGQHSWTGAEFYKWQPPTGAHGTVNIPAQTVSIPGQTVMF